MGTFSPPAMAGRMGTSTLPATPGHGNIPCSGVQNVQYTEALNTFSERSVHLLYLLELLELPFRLA